jgi:hypothetical protein
MLQGEKVIIATKHGKERVIGPLIESELKAQWMLPKNFDTDALGTFTRERKRRYTQKKTAMKKCKRALRGNDARYAISSEGSFIPHPSIPFVSLDVEVVCFYDKRANRYVFGESSGIPSHHGSKMVHTVSEGMIFAEDQEFPKYGLIVRPHAKSKKLEKEIATEESLKKALQQVILKYGSAFLEVDLRAHKNPERMERIKEAAQDCMQNILRICPTCNAYGFSRAEPIRGAKCKLCLMPSDMVKAEMMRCEVCDYSEERELRSEVSPQFCNYCNP